MLWLLAGTVPLLAWFLAWAWRKKQILIAQFVQSRLLAQLTVGVSPARQRIRLLLLVLAVGSALLALARPQWGFQEEQAKQRGLDIVVALDTSRSMLAQDVPPNRLTRAKLAALDLMRLSKTDRLGLVAFAGDAFLQCPLTLDEQAFRQSLEAIEVGIIPQGGTALTAAIQTALQAFKSEGDNYKILVLFTDGEDHERDAIQAAKQAAKAGLRIFTVGVGTPNGELLKVTDEQGVTSYIKDSQGNAVMSRLDETLLRQIATEAGGSYLPLRGANAVETLYEQSLAPLPKAEVSSRLIRRYRERFQWPLALAMVLLLAEMLLPERKRVERTEPIASAANAELRKAVVALLLLAFPLTAAGSPSGAKRLYENGKYKEAQREYERLLEEDGAGAVPGFENALQQLDADKTDDAGQDAQPALEPGALGDLRLHFNAGAAAYKAGDMENAFKHFAPVLTSPDLSLQQRAFYNLGNTLYRLGEQNPELNQKTERWENSVRSFEGALRLDPQNADAKHNLEFVKKKLEELKQQQAKQKQDQRDPNNQDQQKQNQDDPQSDQSEDQSKDQQNAQQDQQQQSEQNSANQDQPKDQPEQENNPADTARDPQEPQDSSEQSQQQAKTDSTPGDQSESNAAPAPAGQMTLQQAQQLLDSQKGEEKALIFVPRKSESPNRIFKDW
jgi:Ca-activated chloride channel family protein